MKIPFFKHDIPAKRAAAVVVALLAVAGVVAGREKPTVELIEARAPRVAAAAELEIRVEKLRRTEASLPQIDPFARRSFAPAAQAVAAAAPAAPAAPVAPPLPFKYFGKLTEKGQTEVFVMRGDDLISLIAGQKIDNEYRVDRITESTLSFTYLPLNTQQSMDLPVTSG
jgi:hypothetical protein